MAKQPELLKVLSDNCKLLYETLFKALNGQDIKIEGSPVSPILHLRLSKPSENRESDERLLQEIVDMAAKENVLLTRAKYVVDQERVAPEPSIRIAVSAGFTRRDVERVCNIVRDCTRKVVKLRK